MCARYQNISYEELECGMTVTVWRDGRHLFNPAVRKTEALTRALQKLLDRDRSPR